MDAATTPLMQDYAYGGGSGGNLTQTISGLTGFAGRHLHALSSTPQATRTAKGSLITLGGTGVSDTGASASTTAVTRMLSSGVGVAYQVFTGTIIGRLVYDHRGQDHRCIQRHFQRSPAEHRARA